jgi:radical SAM protein with 4Fe4S-binding SPASM domain
MNHEINPLPTETTPPSHKVFLQEEYFGSRVYNTKTQEEHFFSLEDTETIKRVFFGNESKDHNLNKMREVLLQKGLLTSDITEIQSRKNRGLSSPLKISLNISKKCNLRCRHCLSSAGKCEPNELTTGEYFKLIDQMREAGTFFITIGGGEPLLRSDLLEVIKYARENFISVSIVTNGTFVTREMAENLNALNLDSITVSLDGLEKNHNYIRGKGSFEKALRGINLLKEYCQSTKLAIRMTVNSRNIGECSEVITLAENLSVDIIRLTPILLLGRAKNNQHLLLSQDDYIRFLEDTQKIKSKIRIQLPNQGDDKKLFVTPEDFGCHCGKEACWITQTGDFYPCIFFGEEFKSGNLREETFLDLWDKSKKMVKLCGNDTCKQCADYKKCRGGCRARALWDRGDINAIDSLCPLKKMSK